MAKGYHRIRESRAQLSLVCLQREIEMHHRCLWCMFVPLPIYSNYSKTLRSECAQKASAAREDLYCHATHPDTDRRPICVPGPVRFRCTRARTERERDRC